MYSSDSKHCFPPPLYHVALFSEMISPAKWNQSRSKSFIASNKVDTKSVGLPCFKSYFLGKTMYDWFYIRWRIGIWKDKSRSFFFFLTLAFELNYCLFNFKLPGLLFFFFFRSWVCIKVRSKLLSRERNLGFLGSFPNFLMVSSREMWCYYVPLRYSLKRMKPGSIYSFILINEWINDRILDSI